MNAAETKTVTVERELPFPPEKIWRALTVPHLMAEWLMQNDFAAETGKSNHGRNRERREDRDRTLAIAQYRR